MAACPDETNRSSGRWFMSRGGGGRLGPAGRRREAGRGKGSSADGLLTAARTRTSGHLH